jgi:glycopeptide antibiotics resistance protein
MSKRLIWTLLLVGYSAALIRVVVFNNLMFRIGHLRFRLTQQSGHANYTPFRTISSYLHGEHGWLIAGVNLVGNVALFVPVGLLAPLAVPNLTWKGSLAGAAAVGLAIEGMELLFQAGEFDVDDLFLNTIGVMVGFALAQSSLRWRPGREGST